VEPEATSYKDNEPRIREKKKRHVENAIMRPMHLPAN
jgi:hypothetical protein